MLGRIFTSYSGVAKIQITSSVCSLTGFRLIIIYLCCGLLQQTDEHVILSADLLVKSEVQLHVYIDIFNT